MKKKYLKMKKNQKIREFILFIHSLFYFANNKSRNASYFLLLSEEMKFNLMKKNKLSRI